MTILLRVAFDFLLPCIALVRPVDESWFVGSAACLLAREVQLLCDEKRVLSWDDFVEGIRPTLWETGVGAEMFVEDNPIWERVVSMARPTTAKDDAISSISHISFMGDLSRDMTIEEADSLPRRSEAEMELFFRDYRNGIAEDIRKSGAKRIKDESASIC